MTRSDRSAIVTGGASGIGRALSEALARRGVDVSVADRQVELAGSVVDGIRAAGGAATVAELDVRDAARFRAVAEETVSRAGRIDYLFNNAGIGVAGEMKDYDAADWDDVIDVNLRGVTHGILAVYPRMIEQGFGHIVNTASMAGLVPGVYSGSYYATKYAVVGLSRSLRIEARPYGVSVSVVCPGVIRTPILGGGRFGRFKDDLDPEKVRRRFEIARPMEPSDFARRVLRGVDRNEAIIIAPWWWRFQWWFERLSPSFSEALVRFFYRRMKTELEAMRRDPPAGR